MTTWMILKKKSKSRTEGEIQPVQITTSYKDAISNRTPADKLIHFGQGPLTQCRQESDVCYQADSSHIKTDTGTEDEVGSDCGCCCDDIDEDPILDHCLDAILDLFEDIKQVMQLRGLMANSRPEGLIDAIRKSVHFVRIEVPDESETSEIDEMEPNLLDAHFV